MPGLRNEDYVAFLDESGEPGLQVVAGVLIPARWLRPAERRWRDFVRHHLGSRSGRTEIKSVDLLHGHGVAIYAQREMLARGLPPISATRAGQSFYRDALEHIASVAEVRILAVGLKTRYPRDAYRLWFWLAYAALAQRPRAPRPRLPMTVIDGEDASFRGAHELVAHRFHKCFWNIQPYVGYGRAWFLGGSVSQQSELLPFVQAADLVAGAARHAIKKSKPLGSWFDTHIRAHAISMGRDVDISGYAVDALRRLDPKDRCQSGYRSALTPP